MNQDNLKIITRNPEEVKKLLSEGKIKVCVIGIGRIGLPTATSFAKSGLETIGVDINNNLVNMINSGDFSLKDERGYEKIFDYVISKKLLSATTEIEKAVPQCDIIILSLPTPIDNNGIPNYSALESVGKKLNQIMKPFSLVIVESTVEPGFIENEFIKIIEGVDHKFEAGKNFGIGVCPENANPGKIFHDFENLPRLVGAFDEHTSNIIMKIYHHVFPVELVKMPDCKSANAVKLTTNVFRYVNIAFVNELAILFERLGIDTYKVLEAADKKYNFQIHFPGPGVGGPCLPVNSNQILNSARKIDGDLLKIVSLSKQINEGMTQHVVNLINNGLNECKKAISDSIIAILGASYKPNVKDLQITPAEPLIKKLLEVGAKIKIFDPYFASSEIFGIKTEETLLDAISSADAAVIITAHEEFHDIDPTLFATKMKNPVVIDCRGIIETSVAKKAGLIFRGIGRGKN